MTATSFPVALFIENCSTHTIAPRKMTDNISTKQDSANDSNRDLRKLDSEYGIAPCETKTDTKPKLQNVCIPKHTHDKYQLTSTTVCRERGKQPLISADSRNDPTNVKHGPCRPDSFAMRKENGKRHDVSQQLLVLSQTLRITSLYLKIDRIQIYQLHQQKNRMRFKARNTKGGSRPPVPGVQNVLKIQHTTQTHIQLPFKFQQIRKRVAVVTLYQNIDRVQIHQLHDQQNKIKIRLASRLQRNIQTIKEIIVNKDSVTHHSKENDEHKREQSTLHGKKIDNNWKHFQEHKYKPILYTRTQDAEDYQIIEGMRNEGSSENEYNKHDIFTVVVDTDTEESTSYKTETEIHTLDDTSATELDKKETQHNDSDHDVKETNTVNGEVGREGTESKVSSDVDEMHTDSNTSVVCCTHTCEAHIPIETSEVTGKVAVKDEHTSRPQGGTHGENEANGQFQVDEKSLSVEKDAVKYWESREDTAVEAQNVNKNKDVCENGKITTHGDGDWVATHGKYIKGVSASKADNGDNATSAPEHNKETIIETDDCEKHTIDHEQVENDSFIGVYKSGDPSIIPECNEVEQSGIGLDPLNIADEEEEESLFGILGVYCMGQMHIEFKR